MFEFDTSKNYQKTTKSKSLIRFQDCDPMEHLNNAKYFDYYYNAREDQVPKLYGVELLAIYTAFDAAWVVYNYQIAYIRPAVMGEWVKIFSRIISFDHNSVIVEYFMTNEDESQLKNILWTSRKYVNVAGNSTEHPDKIMDYLNAVKYEAIESSELDFQKRIKQVKTEILTNDNL
jgi:acyl-CoA thioester hydrolase